MNKRTHWNIARLSVNNLEELIPEYKLTKIKKFLFYLGAIEPDLSIFQFIHPHFYEKSSDYIFSKIEKLYKRNHNLIESYLLGNLVHYLCDFCCYAHRKGCMGQLIDHFIYERRISRYLTINFEDYIKMPYTKLNVTKPTDIIWYIDANIMQYKKMKPSFVVDIEKSL